MVSSIAAVLIVIAMVVVGEYTSTRGRLLLTAVVLGAYVWASLGRRILEPVGFQPTSHRVHTFPAVRPVRPLDRVYCRGNIEALHCFASRAKVARHASDHLPLVADFELPP